MKASIWASITQQVIVLEQDAVYERLMPEQARHVQGPFLWPSFPTKGSSHPSAPHSSPSYLAFPAEQKASTIKETELLIRQRSAKLRTH
jgi:hypothetical protein